MPEIYIDNLHKQLYVTDYNLDASVSTGQSEVMTWGLSDFGELPGQSTWYIRSIRFYAMGYQDEAGVSPDTRFSVLGGIISRDIASSAFYNNVDDFQDVAGWPLNKVQKYFLMLNNPQKNWFSYQHTYRPSKNLTLNREQNIIFSLYNQAGNDMSVILGAYLHAERGD